MLDYNEDKRSYALKYYYSNRDRILKRRRELYKQNAEKIGQQHIVRSRTFLGHLRLRYNAMRRRALRDKLEICTRDDFLYFACFNKTFERLYYVWVDSNYRKDMTPTVDRIDHNRGYTLDNMQFLTFYENARKAGLYESPRRKQVYMTMEDGYTLVFPSLTCASNYIGVCLSSLRKAISSRKQKYRGYFIQVAGG